MLVPLVNDFEVEGRLFFFEKKKQKTFASCVRHPDQHRKPDVARNRQKFFGSFFQKRTAFFRRNMSETIHYAAPS
jgi:hypothetical protein